MQKPNPPNTAPHPTKRPAALFGSWGEARAELILTFHKESN